MSLIRLDVMPLMMSILNLNMFQVKSFIRFYIIIIGKREFYVKMPWLMGN